MTDKPGTNWPKHVCTCGDCSIAFSAFDDRCVYQEALSIALEALEKIYEGDPEGCYAGPWTKEALSRIRKLGEEG